MFYLQKSWKLLSCQIHHTIYYGKQKQILHTIVNDFVKQQIALCTEFSSKTQKNAKQKCIFKLKMSVFFKSLTIEICCIDEFIKIKGKQKGQLGNSLVLMCKTIVEYCIKNDEFW